VSESVVLLHGFSGTHRAWDGVVAGLDHERYLPLALDLPGHGAATNVRGADGRAITFEGCVEYVLARSPERFALAGYSLGGRIALHVALASPERVSRLVLVSSSAGIDDPVARAERRVADHLLADELERIPFEDFIEHWRTQPLFADEPPEVGVLAREDQRRNRPDALAAALRGIGTGEMESLWGRLVELQMPVTVLVGARDEKYRALGQLMTELLPDAQLVLALGGHGLPLENPMAVVEALGGVDSKPTGRG
jgi:2-succinyl-6-hydroxy-2,4-cyclohexadiene-1-carboxylate synthase